MLQEFNLSPVQDIPLEMLEPGQNIRQTPVGVRELSANMRTNGQFVPGIVTPLGESGKFLILDGLRRYLAALEAEMRVLKAVICPQRPSVADLRLMQTSLAFHHCRPSEYELSQALIQIQHEQAGWDQKHIASQLGLSETMVCSHLAVKKATPKVREAYAAGEITTGDVGELIRWRDRQDEALSKRLAGTKRDDLVQLRKRSQASTVSSVRLNRIRLALPQAEITVAGTEIGMAELIEYLSTLLKEAKRAMQQSLDIKTLVAILRDRAN